MREIQEAVTTVKIAIIVKIIITAKEAIEKNVLIAAKKKSTKLRIIMRITIVMIMSDADSTPEAFLNV